MSDCKKFQTFCYCEHCCEKGCMRLQGPGGIPRTDAPVSESAPAQPVAWRYRYGAGGEWKYVDREDECNPMESYTREPLYAQRSMTRNPESTSASAACASLRIAASKGRTSNASI